MASNNDVNNLGSKETRVTCPKNSLKIKVEKDIDDTEFRSSVVSLEMDVSSPETSTGNTTDFILICKDEDTMYDTHQSQDILSSAKPIESPEIGKEFISISPPRSHLRDSCGNSAIHLAVKNGSTEALGVLIQHQEPSNDLNLKNSDGFTPLHLAVLKGSPEMAEILLNAGVDVNARDEKSGRTALHHACESNSQRIVDLLLQHKADQNIRNYAGDIPNSAASERNYMQQRFPREKAMASNNDMNNLGSKETRVTCPKNSLKIKVEKDIDDTKFRSSVVSLEMDVSSPETIIGNTTDFIPICKDEDTMCDTHQSQDMLSSTRPTKSPETNTEFISIPSAEGGSDTEVTQKNISPQTTKAELQPRSNMSIDSEMTSTQLQTKVAVCSICNMAFDSAKTLQKHMKKHTEEKLYKCTGCQKSFQKPKSLKAHMRRHSRKNSYECNICKNTFTEPGSLQRHMKKHTGEKLYQCYLCDKVYVWLHSFKEHLRCHTEERPFGCDICNMAFKNSANLRAHRKIHTGEKNYICSICNKAFFTAKGLREHVRTHTGEKPYECNICHKTFSRSHHLKSHITTHTGEKNYICSICNKAFATAGSLRLHMRTHTGEKPYECHVCGKTFRRSTHLALHMKTHDGTKSKAFEKRSSQKV